MAAAVRMVGGYILLETLGKGGFAKVKRAEHAETHQKVAMKIMEKNPKTQHQLDRELAALQRVRHPNVIRIIAFLGDDVRYPKKNGQIVSKVIFVLELAEGGMLFDFLSLTGPFPEPLARTYFYSLIAAIEACHAQGIAHRDLKPENLLMDANFNLKLADFGMALLQQRIGMTLVGTPSYQAPEMHNGQGYDAMAADVWSIGIILFIMLSGHPAFSKPNLQDWWFDKLSRGKYDLFWEAHLRSTPFSRNAMDLLNRIFQTDPARRITIEGIKAHAWWNDVTLDEAAFRNEMTRRKRLLDDQKQRAARENVIHIQRNPVVRRSLVESDVPLPRPRPYEVQHRIACYTSFRTKVDPVAAIQGICDAVAELNGKYKVVMPEYRVKAFFDDEEKGQIVIQMELFEVKSADVGSSSASDSVYVCEIRRFAGDLIAFTALYRLLEQQMALLIVDESVALSSDSAAPAASSALASSPPIDSDVVDATSEELPPSHPM